METNHSKNHFLNQQDTVETLRSFPPDYRSLRMIPPCLRFIYKKPFITFFEKEIHLSFVKIVTKDNDDLKVNTILIYRLYLLKPVSVLSI